VPPFRFCRGGFIPPAFVFNSSLRAVPAQSPAVSTGKFFQRLERNYIEKQLELEIASEISVFRPNLGIFVHCTGADRPLRAIFRHKFRVHTRYPHLLRKKCNRKITQQRNVNPKVK
jgi:hypothetical protein